MSNPQDLAARTFTMERLLDAPRSLVWQAWTQPEHIAQWWAPKGMAMTIVAHSFEVGGAWKYSMPMPNGVEFISEGVYTEIVPEEKIVSTADFRPMTEGVIISASFSEEGDKTRMVFSVVHRTEEYAKQQEEMGIEKGWGSVFTQLADFLKSE